MLLLSKCHLKMKDEDQALDILMRGENLLEKVYKKED